MSKWNMVFNFVSCFQYKLFHFGNGFENVSFTQRSAQSVQIYRMLDEDPRWKSEACLSLDFRTS